MVWCPGGSPHPIDRHGLSSSYLTSSTHKVSQPREPPPRLLSELYVNLSAHTAPIIQSFNDLAFSTGSSHPMVGQFQKPDDPGPWLHLHYRGFFTTTPRSAPVRRIGTQILVGLPLESLPLHRHDRFPRSARKPVSRSRRLHAGHRLDSKQVSSRLIPG